MKRTSLIAIDCQNDFIEGGTLGVPGGRDAVQNVAQLVNRLGKKFTNVYASLDSHQPFQIFHAPFWLDQNNKHPDLYGFTPITHADVMSGKWRAARKQLQPWVEEYTEKLESNGRYTHMVWPMHCILYTKGWLLEDSLSQAFLGWEKDNLNRINFISKGNNPYVENFSAFEAEVARADDPATQLNTQLISALEEDDELVFSGLAGSHCLKFSMLSIFNNFSNGDYLKKCVLLKDCTAPVPGFEQQQEDFIREYEAKGMKVTTSKDYLA